MAHNHDDIRAQRANELRWLYNFLNRTAKVTGIANLTAAAKECAREKPGGKEDLWGYSFLGIVFEPEDVGKILPPDATNIRIELSMSVTGYCDPKPDPLTALAADIVIKGQRVVDKQTVPLIFSWHIDRRKGERIEGNASEPLYHVQHAGSVMKGFEASWGSAVFLEAPRLVHPPLNAFIACDLILSNFLPKAREKLARDGNYKRWLGQAQRDIWKPYIEGISSAWSEKPEEGLCRDFWPDLII